MTPVTCGTCGRHVTTIAQWFSENCPDTVKPGVRIAGHALYWEQILALQLRPQLQQEAQDVQRP